MEEKNPWNTTDILTKNYVYFTKIIWSVYSLPVGRDPSMLPDIFYLRHPICLYLQAGVRGRNLIKLSRCSLFKNKMLLLSSLCLHTCFHLQVNWHIFTRKFSCYLVFQTRSSKIHWLWFSVLDLLSEYKVTTIIKYLTTGKSIIFLISSAENTQRCLIKCKPILQPFPCWKH